MAKVGMDATHKNGRDFNWVDQLYKDFPRAMSNVYCGAWFGQGWYEPIRKAVAVIEASGGLVAQIKNKFDNLRIYIDEPESGWNGWDVWKEIACYMAIDEAERSCRRICEGCGGERVKAQTEHRHKRVCTKCNDTSY